MYPIGMTHSEIINLWPSIAAFANDIGVSYGTAKAMRQRNSIAAKHWPKVVKASEANGISGVTYEWLTETHASKYTTQPEALNNGNS